MPRSLAAQIAARGFTVQDVRDVGLRGQSDDKVLAAAVAADAIIITRDRGFTLPRNWPPAFTAGVIFVNLPENASAGTINAKVMELLAKRLPESLQGTLTTIELHRALSRTMRRRR